MIAHVAGTPRVGDALAASPDGVSLWADSGAACIAPQFNHLGCPLVPARLLDVVSLGERRSVALRAVPAGRGLPSFGGIAFFPDGVRALDGSYILDTTRLHALEVLPAAVSVQGQGVLPPDGSHLYLPIATAGGAAIADFRPTPARCAPSPTEIAHWWPGDGSADDAWGMVNGRLTNGAGFVPGVAGQAFSFARPGASVVFGPDPALDFPLAGTTLLVWIKALRPGPAPALEKMDAIGHAGWSLRLDRAARLSFCVGGGAHDGCGSGSPLRFTSPRALSLGVWHSAAVVTGNGVALYLDGLPNGRANLDLRFSDAPGAAMRLGADSLGSRFSGALDEVMIYQRPLSPGEIAQMAHLPACLAAGALSPGP